MTRLSMGGRRVLHPGGGLPEERGVQSMEHMLGVYQSALHGLHITIQLYRFVYLTESATTCQAFEEFS